MMEKGNREKAEAERKQVILAGAEKNRERLDKREKELIKDEENLSSQYQVSQRMLENAEKHMDIAIEKMIW